MPHIDYDQIKPEIRASIDRYVKDRMQTGGFLRAVLENNLKESFMRADERNIETLFHIVAYVYNEVPFNAWGSPEKVEAWLNPKEVEK